MAVGAKQPAFETAFAAKWGVKVAGQCHPPIIWLDDLANNSTPHSVACHDPCNGIHLL